MDRILIRGDDYVMRRQVLRATLIDPDLPLVGGQPAPFNMSLSKIRMTFKTSTTDIDLDPTDAEAYIKADIEFDGSGVVVGSPRLFALPPGGTAAEGVLYLTMDRDMTATLPTSKKLLGDIQVTDANGEDSTIPVLWVIVAEDSYTNRRTTL